jgi:uncharacterized protein (TIGR03083 family)
VDVNRTDLEELLGVYALDALEPDERADVEAFLAHEPDLALEAAHLQTAAVLLAAEQTVEPAASLRDTTLASAISVRMNGWHVDNPDGASIRAADLHRRQWDDLAGLLVTLSDADWQATTSYGCSVSELMAHLSVSLEHMAHSYLDAGDFVPPAGTENDHWAMTRPTIERLLVEPRQAIIDALADVNDRIVAALPAREAALGDISNITSAAVMVRGRVFEMWMHSDDVRRAIGRALLDPDHERLAALCQLAADATPAGMTVTRGGAAGKTLRLVLTGPGGGTFVRPMAYGDSASGGGDLLIVAAAVDFCRLAGKLLDPADFIFKADGDVELVDAVLAGARAFAE